MKQLSRLLMLAACFLTVPLTAQSISLTGNWAEPGGSVIRIESCPSGLCMKLIAISPTAGGTKDVNNPSKDLRDRSLCGLQIGSNFKPEGSTRATGGTLYDPKSGNTYHGTMSLDGANLKLRGYVGVPIFGRTEVWRRASAGAASCGSESGSPTKH